MNTKTKVPGGLDRTLITCVDTALLEALDQVLATRRAREHHRGISRADVVRAMLWEGIDLDGLDRTARTVIAMLRALPKTVKQRRDLAENIEPFAPALARAIRALDETR